MGSEERSFRRVLLVEDSDEMRGLLRYWLQGDGRFEVAGEAADGAAGVTAAQELQPDVVVLDLYLPVLDGLAALPRIREVAPESKVVVISGDGDPGGRSRQALALGAAAYIEKVEFIATMEAVSTACFPPVDKAQQA